MAALCNSVEYVRGGREGGREAVAGIRQLLQDCNYICHPIITAPDLFTIITNIDDIFHGDNYN